MQWYCFANKVSFSRFRKGEWSERKTPWRSPRSPVHDNHPPLLHQHPPLQQPHNKIHSEHHSQTGIRFHPHHFQHNAKTHNNQEKYFQFQYCQTFLGLQTPFCQLWRHLRDGSVGSSASAPATRYGNQRDRRRIFLHHNSQTGGQSGSVYGQTGNFWHAEILFYPQQKCSATAKFTSSRTKSSSLTSFASTPSS